MKCKCGKGAHCYHQKSVKNEVWRWYRCPNCKLIFTTIEKKVKTNKTDDTKVVKKGII